MATTCNCLLAGSRFGRLEVIENVGIVNRNTSYKCKCDCGNIKIIAGFNLKSGHTQSCGCFQREMAASYSTKLTLNSGMIGQKYGRLKVLVLFKVHNKRTLFKCRCDCGNILNVERSNLLTGHSRSCGCLAKETSTTHGMSHFAEYPIWVSMIQRCHNKNSSVYSYYGGRGITVCQEWKDSFENFYHDMGERPEGLSIERVNNNLSYSKDNCIWANRTTQSRNRCLGINNKTGMRGIHLLKRNQKYCVQIKAEGRTHTIGNFSFLEDAKIARLKAEQKYWRTKTVYNESKL